MPACKTYKISTYEGAEQGWATLKRTTTEQVDTFCRGEPPIHGGSAVIVSSSTQVGWAYKSSASPCKA
eukprot:6472116-Amphidinium_carterae.1